MTPDSDAAETGPWVAFLMHQIAGLEREAAIGLIGRLFGERDVFEERDLADSLDPNAHESIDDVLRRVSAGVSTSRNEIAERFPALFERDATQRPFVRQIASRQESQLAESVLLLVAGYDDESHSISQRHEGRVLFDHAHAIMIGGKPTSATPPIGFVGSRTRLCCRCCPR